MDALLGMGWDGMGWDGMGGGGEVLGLFSFVCCGMECDVMPLLG
jgi:hypothetical protein